MRLKLKIEAFLLPRSVTAEEALALHRRGFFDDPFLLMAKDWRVDPVDDDYEELNDDELDHEDFLTDFADATLELWSRY
ncbi:MAG: hypothetical protein ABI147_01270 [Acidobacteriaceae bacterium]